MTLAISRILHAGYVFDCEGTRIAFDPIVENPFSRNCHAFPDVRFDQAQIRATRFDAVFISHYHDDHCSFDSLDLLDRATPLYVYCLFDQLFDMLAALGFRNVQQLRTNVPVQVGSISVTPREALDAEVDSLFHIAAGGMQVLNVVDAWIAPRALDLLAAYAPWDMVLWPFQTMRELAVLSPARAAPAALTLPEDWIDELRVLAPRYVVPSSCQFLQEPWSWYNQAFFPISYRQFQREVEAALPATRVVRLNPSVTVLLDAEGLTPGQPLPWVLPVGEQDVDYAYDPEQAVPSTADIARRFAPLGAAETAQVLQYCSEGLPARYRSMELPEGSYFEQARLWQLSVYDHEGKADRFRYRIEGDTIAPAAGEGGPFAWTTDLPIARLHAALVLGETLTSLYLRINEGQVLDDPDLADAELVDDPLIRCLYNDVFGAYQAAQLARLSQRNPGP